MTTIQSFYNESTGSVLMLADSQVSAGHLIVPCNFQKILEVGSSLLLASSGSVADSQFLSKEILKTLQIKKIISDETDLNLIDIREFANELSSWLFNQNRSYYSKPFESSFLLAGFSQAEKKNMIYSVDTDGSIINLKFFSIGSGCELALSQLSNLYESNKEQKLNDEDIAAVMSNILWEVQKLDCFTNQLYNVICVQKDGTIKRFSKQLEIKKEVKSKLKMKK